MAAAAPCDVTTSRAGQLYKMLIPGPSKPTHRAAPAVGMGSYQRPHPPQPGTRQSCLSHTSSNSNSTRRQQAKMGAEYQQVQEMIQHIQETESGFVKEVDKFLRKHEVAEVRRRELLHKRWTERVWLPVKNRLEKRVSDYGPAESKRKRCLYNDFLHHSNTKDVYYLDIYDPKEYYPFPAKVSKPHDVKGISSSQRSRLKDPLSLQRQ